MTAREKHARMQFIDTHMKLTVWVRRCTDGSYEAIDYYGTVIASSKYRADCERQVNILAADRKNNIFATAVIVYPEDRQPNARRRSYRTRG